MQRIFNYQADKKQPLKSFLHNKGYSKDIITFLKKVPNQILVNDQKANITCQLNIGDKITIVFDEEGKKDRCTNLPIDIIYEDEDLLVVNKPRRMPVHTSVDHLDDSLENAVLGYYQKQNESLIYRCINRLDCDTCGLVVIAKNKLSASLLHHTNFKKKYYAIVEGRTLPFGFINKPIMRVGQTYERKVDENGKPSITLYHRKKYLVNKDVSLLDIRLLTGRTHQIRVHFKYIKHPLIGDEFYNPENKQMDKQALQCYHMSFIHPLSKEKLVFELPLAVDMQQIINN